MARGNISETNKATDEPRNVVWVGEGDVPHTISVEMEPPIRLTLTTDEARAGFYHPKAGLLISQNDGFKEWREDKGATT